MSKSKFSILNKNRELKQDKSGFTLLIAIVITSMLIIASFVVVNIALKQIVLSNAAKESQFAFYNADSGVECAIYWDLEASTNLVGSTLSMFATSTPGTVTCNGQPTISTNSQDVPIPNLPTKSLIGGGGDAKPTSIFWLQFTKGCVIVRVTKNPSGSTTIDSRGYNICDISSPNRYERGIQITY